MLNHKSAEKRARQSRKIRERHRIEKGYIRSLMKGMRKIDEPEKLQTQLKMTYSALDKAKKKGLLHKNTVDRYKSRMSKILNTKTSA